MWCLSFPCCSAKSPCPLWLSGEDHLSVQETWVWSLSREDLPEKEMATHSSILAWEIPSTEENGGLQSMGSQRVGYDWVSTHTQAYNGTSLFDNSAVRGPKGTHWAKIKVSPGLCSSWRLWRMVCSLAFPSFRGGLHFLGSWPLPPPSSRQHSVFTHSSFSDPDPLLPSFTSKEACDAIGCIQIIQTNCP